MASAAPAESLEARELSLVSKVELRIALADSDEKLQKLLQTYLAPLLLKLTSESLAVRNKVIAICQHINTRIKPQSIQLPVTALLKQFKEQSSQLIRHFDLIYIQQGIDRLDASSRVELLPAALQGISQLEIASAQTASVFNLVLRLLPLLRLPPKDSPEDHNLRDKLSLSKADTQYLSSWLGKLLLLSQAAKNATTCPGLSPSEYTFLNRSATFEETWNPAQQGGLNLTETKFFVAKFLASGAFDNPDRFLPAVILSADSNSRLADIGDDILKRFNPDLENAETVEQLYKIYFGTTGSDAALPARIPLQVKILSFLGKSVKATVYTDRIIKLLDEGLFSDIAKSVQGLQASKLRSQIFMFITWVVRMGAPTDLKVIAPEAVVGLRQFVESQGWPDPGASGQKLSQTDVGLRGLAYESIGVLAPKIALGDSIDYIDMDLLRWLFTSLASDASASEIYVSIEQALGSILNSCTGNLPEDIRLELGSFLELQMKSQIGTESSFNGYPIVRSTHYTAVRYANRCLPYWDLTARWVDLLAIASTSNSAREVIEEGRKGLHPYWYRLLNPARGILSSADSENQPQYKFPSFQQAADLLVRLADPEFSQPNLRGVIAPAVRFCKNLLVREALSKAQVPVDIDQEWEYRLETLLQSDTQARHFVKELIFQQPDSVMTTWLNSTLDGVSLPNASQSTDCSKDFVDISSLTSNKVLTAVTPRALSIMEQIFSTNNHILQRTAARIFGILASHTSVIESDCQRIFAELLDISTAWKSAAGQAANKVRGAVLAAAYFASRLSYRRRLAVLPEAQIGQYITLVFEILVESRDSQLLDAVQVTIGQLALAQVLNLERLSKGGDWKAIKAKLEEHAKKEQENAIHALGQLSLVILRSNGEDQSEFAEVMALLHALHEIRKPEVQFPVGESMCTAAAGWDSKSLIGEFDVDESPLEAKVPETILAELADKLIADCKAPKPSLRKASAIWLLCLVKDCGQLASLQQRLRQFQAAFAGLLADRDEVVQETGSRGLSLVYEMGDQNLRDDLVRDLVGSFTGNEAKLGGKVTGDTELFEPGALPTGEGKSVTTYKDIMNLASEVGDPSLVYRFMSLASNNAIWSSRAAFGRFGLSTVLSDSSVSGYLARNPKIYPKLYRYRFDPNPNVQRSMNDIWQALVKDPTTLLDTHFDAIMDDLLSSIIAGREWRTRQASCAAIADLLQGRPVEKYDKYLNEILGKAFKVMDDIKESVRTAALRLCQVITNILIRTLETGDTDSKRARTMLGHIIPFLLGQDGMESSAQEVQGYAITTLVQIIKKSPSALLRPFMAQILDKFLSSLSSLEPQAVNYVHLNADKYGLTGQEIDKMRLSSIRMSPMMESIERYLLDGLDESAMKEVAAKLEGTLRTAVGLPSKVGCSRVLALLSTKNLLFRPYADRFIQLLTKHVLDRNETVSVSYSASIGYLIRLANDERVLDTIKFTKSLYFNAEDTSHRIVAGEILHSMSKLSSDRFSNFATAALPFVFVAKQDTDEQTREIFEKTWQDNVGGPRAVALYLTEITAIISERLDSSNWVIKHSACLATADAVTSLGKSIDQPTGDLIWPSLEKALSGKTWDGKEKVLKAFIKFTENARPIWQPRGNVSHQMKVRATPAAQFDSTRNNLCGAPVC
jgi:proteasome component ECM29